jgi:hypothetical protein
VPAVQQVPHRRDEDVVLHEDPLLVGVEVRRPRMAAARLVVVRHRRWGGKGGWRGGGGETRG